MEMSRTLKLMVERSDDAKKLIRCIESLELVNQELSEISVALRKNVSMELISKQNVLRSRKYNLQNDIDAILKIKSNTRLSMIISCLRLERYHSRNSDGGAFYFS